MDIEIKTPDGGVARFPDGTPDAVIEAALAQEFPASSGGPDGEAGRSLGPIEAGLVKAAQGLTANFSDEFEGGVRALWAKAGGDSRPFSKIFSDEVTPIRKLITEADKQQPMASLAGEVVGSALGVGKLLKSGLATRVGTGLGKVTASLAEGAGVGAAFGAGQADDNLEGAIEGAQSGAIAGAVLGPVGLGLGKAVGTAADALAGRFTAIPQLDALRTAAGEAYKRASDAGLVISQNGFSRLARTMHQTANRAGIDRTIHPKVTAALSRVADLVDSTPTLEQMDILRRVVKSAARSTEPDERRIAALLVDELDDFVTKIAPRDIVAGDRRVAVPALKEGRALWLKLKRGEIVDELFEKARNSSSNFSASGFENSLRVQFRQLANNQKKLRAFSKGERQAILKVARGGNIDNLARLFGKLAPTGVVSGAFSSGLGFMVGGPTGAVAVPAAGLLARALATQRTLGNARTVDRLARSGGALPPPTQAGLVAGAGVRGGLLGQAPAAADLADELGLLGP